MKTHLTYKINGSRTGAALCGNNARGYKYGLRAVSPAEFRSTPSDDRCAHCEREYLLQRNRVRKSKGLAPVIAPFFGQEASA